MGTSVPVTIVTGFLGAGKTTLVNHWLREGEGLAVIVNELGAVGVDGEMLKARARALVEIAGGCICCSTQAELARALDSLSGAERILVETAGAASPATVVRAVQSGGARGAYALDGVVTVVDATRIGALEEHALAIEQIGYADVVVLSRADRLGAQALAAARASVLGHNGTAHVVPAAHGALALADALARRAELPPAPPPAPHHDYDSIALVHEGELDGDRFSDFVAEELARAASRLFRTKAIVAVAGVAERMIVQGVGDAAEISFGAPWEDAPRTSRLVVVGYGLDRAALELGFRACAVDGGSASGQPGSAQNPS